MDRGLALWAGRDAARPTFLYLHFMDAHMPRFLPEAEPRFPVPGYDWRARFRPDGEPDFDRARRSWNQFDASDFTPDDRRYFAAVYDTLWRTWTSTSGACSRRSAATTPPCPGP